jgi:hypothetical protein
LRINPDALASSGSRLLENTAAELGIIEEERKAAHY